MPRSEPVSVAQDPPPAPPDVPALRRLAARAASAVSGYHTRWARSDARDHETLHVMGLEAQYAVAMETVERRLQRAARWNRIARALSAP
jgi:hypothetical protein